MVIVQLLAIKLLQSLLSFCTSFWNLFSGFLIPRSLIPVWWRWYYWGSPIAWTIYGIFASPFGDLKTVIDTPKGPQRVDLSIPQG
ncbi:hypothetical protein PRUPE_6G128800 [Prunus persica]|uniref:ABC-2 type transporter transmembrane domain-containing protein n=1 Tax=Prunus persica TaxID=3760 RepID=A0A251NR62_PRUPE|nr:hypothetical protein PRUPE_6G128800 [Prunus persica]